MEGIGSDNKGEEAHYMLGNGICQLVIKALWEEGKVWVVSMSEKIAKLVSMGWIL